MLALRERVTSDWFGLNVDIKSLRTGDPYEEIAHLTPHACTWQIKEHLYRKGRRRRRTSAGCSGSARRRGTGATPLRDAGPGDPREKVRRFLDEARSALG
jgi:hypothetical protein